MKSTDLRALSVEEIKSKIAENEQLVDKLKFAHAVSPIENPMKIRTTKRLIARFKTELSLR
jgi:large subunit ribosomal protein L29